jgi:hypothetical protein
MNLELIKKRTVPRFDRAGQPAILMGIKSSYSTPNPSANIIIFSGFGYFSPFSISLKYETDNPVSTASCLRPNPFYCLKQRSFIPKKNVN